MLNNQQSDNPAKLYNQKPRNERSSANNVNTNTTSSPTQSLRCRSKSQLVLNINSSSTQRIALESVLSLSSSMPSLNPTCCDVCYDPSYVTSKCSLLAHPYHALLALLRSQNVKKEPSERQEATRNSRQLYNRDNRFRGCGRGKSSALDRNPRVSQPGHNNAPIQKI